jgi:IS5 family transposase
MFQQTFAAQVWFEKYGRTSRRELFLDGMNPVVPWAELQALIESHYAKAGLGRLPVGRDHAADLLCAVVVQLIRPPDA